MVINKTFWKGKRVLITGHSGFKGGWLALWLQDLGAIVTGFSLNPPTVPNLFSSANVAEQMDSIEGDIRDFDNLHKAIKKSKPQIVFHLAAQPLVRTSYEDPIDTYTTNVIGTLNVLESIRKTTGVKVIIIITSDKCYENKEWVWGYRENDPMGGHDPYSSSKGCAEILTASYRRSFYPPETISSHGLAIATARAGNVIGGGDWAKDRLIPDVMKALTNNKPVIIRNPGAIRPWQHVLDPLHGYLMLAEKSWNEGSIYADAWNFGPQSIDTQPVSWIVDRFCKLWNKSAQWHQDDENHPHESHNLKLDCSKANKYLNWIPRWNLEKALDMTITWYKAYEKKEDMHEYTMSQIREYLGN